MSEKHPGPLVVEGKLSDAERMKLESNYLRGTIVEDLNDGLTGGLKRQLPANTLSWHVSAG